MAFAGIVLSRHLGIIFKCELIWQHHDEYWGLAKLLEFLR